MHIRTGVKLALSRSTPLRTGDTFNIWSNFLDKLLVEEAKTVEGYILCLQESKKKEVDGGLTRGTILDRLYVVCVFNE